MVASNINPTSSDYNIMAEYWKDRSKMAVCNGFPVSKAKVELISTVPKDEIGSWNEYFGHKIFRTENRFPRAPGSRVVVSKARFQLWMKNA